MSDSLQDLQTERNRLLGKEFNGISVVVDSVTMTLKIKDGRAPSVGGNPNDFNQGLAVLGYTPGSWHVYTVAQSQATFS